MWEGRDFPLSTSHRLRFNHYTRKEAQILGKTEPALRSSQTHSGGDMTRPLDIPGYVEDTPARPSLTPRRKQRYIQPNCIHMDIYSTDTDRSSETIRQRKRYTQTLRCTQKHGGDTYRPLATPRDTKKETVGPSDIAKPT